MVNISDLQDTQTNYTRLYAAAEHILIAYNDVVEYVIISFLNCNSGCLSMSLKYLTLLSNILPSPNLL